VRRQQAVENQHLPRAALLARLVILGPRPVVPPFKRNASPRARSERVASFALPKSIATHLAACGRCFALKKKGGPKVRSADRPARNLTPLNIQRRTHQILLEQIE
jgi:hypothetical protein